MVTTLNQNEEKLQNIENEEKETDAAIEGATEQSNQAEISLNQTKESLTNLQNDLDIQNQTLLQNQQTGNDLNEASDILGDVENLFSGFNLRKKRSLSMRYGNYF